MQKEDVNKKKNIALFLILKMRNETEIRSKLPRATQLACGGLEEPMHMSPY